MSLFRRSRNQQSSKTKHYDVAVTPVDNLEDDDNGSELLNAAEIEDHDEADRLELEARERTLQYRLEAVVQRVGLVENRVDDIEEREHDVTQHDSTN